MRVQFGTGGVAVYLQAILSDSLVTLSVGGVE